MAGWLSIHCASRHGYPSTAQEMVDVAARASTEAGLDRPPRPRAEPMPERAAAAGSRR